MQRTTLAGALALTMLGAILPAFGQSELPGERPIERVRGDLIHIFTGDVEIPAGTIREGVVVSVGGRVKIHGEVDGNVVVVLGALEIDGGTVRNNVTGVLSDMRLENARVEGELVNVLGGMDHRNVLVGREMFDLGLFGTWLPPLLTVITWLRVLGLLCAFAIVVLLVAIAPDRVRLIGQEAAARYVSALFAGLLVYLVLLLFLLPLALATLIGLPFLLLALVVLKWLGLAGIFHALGQRVGRAFGREVSPLGAVMIVFAVYVAVLLALSPWGIWGLVAIALFHMVFFVFFEVPALGLVVLTRAGTRGGARPSGPPVPWNDLSGEIPPAAAPPPTPMP
jgi:hypothetical protein